MSQGGSIVPIFGSKRHNSIVLVVAFTFYHLLQFCPIVYQYKNMCDYIVLTSKLTCSNQLKQIFQPSKWNFYSSFGCLFELWHFDVYYLSAEHSPPPSSKAKDKFQYTLHVSMKESTVNMTAYNSYHRTVDTFANSKCCNELELHEAHVPRANIT